MRPKVSVPDGKLFNLRDLLNASNKFAADARPLISAEIMLWENSRSREAGPKKPMRTSEELARPIKTDFLFFSCEELEQPSTTAPPEFLAQSSLLDIQSSSTATSSPSIATLEKSTAEPMLAKNSDFPFFSCEELGQPSTTAPPEFPAQSSLLDSQSSSPTTSSPSIATLEKSTAEPMPAKNEETMEQKLVEAETKASRQHMQAAKVIRDLGGSGVPFRVGIGFPLAEVANPIAVPGSVPPTPLQMYPHAKKSKSGNSPTTYTIVEKICAAALAAVGTNAIQFEEAVRVIYN